MKRSVLETFEKKPGRPCTHRFEDGSGLFTLSPPDRIRLPDEIGGHWEPVQRVLVSPCLYCQRVDGITHDATTYELASVFVQECERICTDESPTGSHFWFSKATSGGDSQ